jgi:hypothetical protein
MLNFPSAPTVGQRFPPYTWDGVKWTTTHASLTEAIPSDSPMSMDGIASAGSSVRYARGDHVHPTDTSRAAIDNSVFTGVLTAASLNVVNVSARRITSSGNANRLGSARGASAAGAVQASDANIRLHYVDSGNWSGLGTDGGGALWIRTGSSGSPVPVVYVNNVQTVVFRDSPTGKTATAGDNSTKLATTEFVKGRSGSGSYVPLTGGTVSGNLTHAAVDLWVHNNTSYGVIYLGNSGARYLQWDGTNYNFNGASVSASQGRIHGTSDFSIPYNNARLAHIGDYGHGQGVGLEEPYGGSTITGMDGTQSGRPWTKRYRQFQYYTTGWFAVAYA